MEDIFINFTIIFIYVFIKFEGYSFSQRLGDETQLQDNILNMLLVVILTDVIFVASPFELEW